MTDRVRGKVVVITGASTGIGSSTAQLLARQGTIVVLDAWRGDRLEALASEIEASGGKAAIRITDVAKCGDVEGLVGLAEARFGHVDVLVNNAADTRLFRLRDAQADKWSKQIDTKIKGVIYGVAAAFPRMLKRESGHIINIASVLATAVMPTTTIYSASKYALRAISEGVRIEGGDKLGSTIIYPGATMTEVVTTVAYKRLSAEAIASAVCYAISQPDDVDVNEIVIRPTAQPN